MPSGKSDTPKKGSLYDLTPPELESFFLSIDEKRFRAKQVLDLLYQHPVGSFDEMSTLPKPLREKLSAVLHLAPLALRTTVESKDGTIKHAYEIVGRSKGGMVLESVWMPAEKTDLGPMAETPDKHNPGDREKRRHTLCISSQLGCAVGCVFCATGKIGLKGQLSTGQIVYQVVHARKLYGKYPDTVLFMGMGEPMHNFEAVSSAVEILTHNDAVGLSPKRIVVSTSGEINKLGAFHRRFQTVRLAISLNSATDSVRSKLMPINETYNLNAIQNFIAGLNLSHGAKVTLEYIVISGVNDRAGDQRALVGFLKPISTRVKVNLIPCNPVTGMEFGFPDMKRISEMQAAIRGIGIMAFIRKNKGRGASAACGQLAGRL